MAKQLKKTINGLEYTYQKLSAMEWIRLKERSVDEKSIIRDSLFFEEVAEHIIVDPKIDVEEFEDYEELTEVMKHATFLHQGKGSTKK